MNDYAKAVLNKMIDDTPELIACKSDLIDAFSLLKECYRSGGKVMVCGNGGSAADAEHIVGELMKGFTLRRKIDDKKRQILVSLFENDGDYLANHLQGALPAISLVSQTALSTAFANDVAPDMVFAQQVYGYAKKGDIIIGLTTSGNSKNIINAFKVGKAFGVKCIGMTGEDGGAAKDFCDVMLKSPAKETYRVQEYHLMMYHALCAMIEVELFES